MRFILFISVIILFSTCVDNYEFAIDNDKKVLIVEAVLTDEQKSHRVTLSLTRGINDADQDSKDFVSQATIWLQDDTGVITNYIETSTGIYETNPSFAGEVGKMYTLNIETPDGKKYISEQELLRQSIPMDSVYGRYIEKNSDESGNLTKGVQFFVDANRISESNSNFRYEFEESYMVIVPFPSTIEVISQSLSIRNEDLTVCFNTLYSNEILIATTNGLSSPNIQELPIRYILDKEAQLRFQYLIVVKQHSISPNAYQYYKSLKENNESAGGFSDQQKGTVLGNISEINNPNEPVLGYFQVGGVSIAHKKVAPQDFIKDGFVVDRSTFGCDYTSVADTLLVATLFPSFLHSGQNIYTYGDFANSTVIVVPQVCSDCRLLGILEKPLLWD